MTHPDKTRGISLLALAASAALALPAQATLVTFDYTGAAQTWTAPTGVRGVRIVAQGAQGAGFTAGSVVGTGGLGGQASGTLAVRAGQTLSVTVGGQGGGRLPNGSLAIGLGGFNGGGTAGMPFATSASPIANLGSGGGGGGASDVRVDGAGLSDRVIVAGGGGGTGGFEASSRAGGGGGGGGGYYGGGGGSTGAVDGGSLGGGGGTASAGGTGGAGTLNGQLLGATGTAGSLGQGGTGGRLTGDAYSRPPRVGTVGAGGAGGGGDGSAAARNPQDSRPLAYSGSGGGGGSSYVGGVSNGSTADGVRAGDGLVTFEYVAALLGGTPGAGLIDFGSVALGSGPLGGFGFGAENIGEATSALTLGGLTGLGNGFSLRSGNPLQDLLSDGVAGSGDAVRFLFDFDPTGLSAGLYATDIVLHSDAGDLRYTLQARIQETDTGNDVPEPAALGLVGLALALCAVAGRYRRSRR